MQPTLTTNGHRIETGKKLTDRLWLCVVYTNEKKMQTVVFASLTHTNTSEQAHARAYTNIQRKSVRPERTPVERIGKAKGAQKKTRKKNVMQQQWQTE